MHCTSRVLTPYTIWLHYLKLVACYHYCGIPTNEYLWNRGQFTSFSVQKPAECAFFYELSLKCEINVIHKKLNFFTLFAQMLFHFRYDMLWYRSKPTKNVQSYELGHSTETNFLSFIRPCRQRAWAHYQKPQQSLSVQNLEKARSPKSPTKVRKNRKYSEWIQRMHCFILQVLRLIQVYHTYTRVTKIW